MLSKYFILWFFANNVILVYSTDYQIGQTVPYYKVYKLQSGAVAKRTTFNNDTTKFFGYRDHNYSPGENDNVIPFPQYGMFK